MGSCLILVNLETYTKNRAKTHLEVVEQYPGQHLFDVYWKQRMFK